jgi:hypothetical protein
MTGKEIKEFAAKVCDDAEVQIHSNCASSYRMDWTELQAKHLRAVLVATGEDKEETEPTKE